LPGDDAALGLPAPEVDPPPPGLGDGEVAGTDAPGADEDDPPESVGVLAAGADEDDAPEPVADDELGAAPEHPAMVPARASAAAASSARLTRADDVIDCPSSVMRPNAHRMPCPPVAGTPHRGKRYMPYDADTAVQVGINRAAGATDRVHIGD
jgi:hypothetical protein